MSSKWARFALIAIATMCVGGCSDHPAEIVHNSNSSSSSPTSSTIATVTISAAEIERCGDESIRTRIADALSQTNISEDNSPLALPQDLVSPDLAAKQLLKWDTLSSAERAYQLCFNYQQGSFNSSAIIEQ